ncbi:MAG: hypothetical protein CM1200mP2_55710 [Planctomycetaceae bacterium]|nr:MAG: hypothetical protein CM1200mP2_55710 [Planctomycetaceae bacterium]
MSDSVDSLGSLELIDLSVPLEDAAVSEPMPPSIHYVTHEAEGLAQMQQFFGIDPDDLVYSNGQGWAIEKVEAITHTGTHVDAPFPLRGRVGRPPGAANRRGAPGVVFCSRGPAGCATQGGPGEEITVEDLQGALAVIEYTLSGKGTSCCCGPGRTPAWSPPSISSSRGWGGTVSCGWSNRGANDRYRRLHDRQAVRRHGGRLPQDRDGRPIWPAHFAGITREYCQIEKLANPDRLPGLTVFGCRVCR